jgi:hypothetical protein
MFRQQSQPDRAIYHRKPSVSIQDLSHKEAVPSRTVAATTALRWGE